MVLRETFNTGILNPKYEINASRITAVGKNIFWVKLLGARINTRKNIEIS